MFQISLRLAAHLPERFAPEETCASSLMRMCLSCVHGSPSSYLLTEFLASGCSFVWCLLDAIGQGPQYRSPPEWLRHLGPPTSILRQVCCAACRYCTVAVCIQVVFGLHLDSTEEKPAVPVPCGFPSRRNGKYVHMTAYKPFRLAGSGQCHKHNHNVLPSCLVPKQHYHTIENVRALPSPWGSLCL